ncbi:hypothetical protein SAMN05421678_101374 [Actinopolymorpha cephalotaxi]|uniref:Glycerophosphoryl diester phosphodiesterase membrane domain-containing protein n=1 Tax=Actinopolymorpha cephalotaxi TaxID=504797 RepID=A0A1I2KMM5_9ACTN|nr:hypothetical protein [Actinopolymorpha cephalotaxi]NYH84517.1 hypothetical protein [Actinopolymorpha cephalotaxi]SFF67579.1 hypothetical protein SAMN05421678_101374 [Actinopolymorpha cephalotaxi]
MTDTGTPPGGPPGEPPAGRPGWGDGWGDPGPPPAAPAWGAAPPRWGGGPSRGAAPPQAPKPGVVPLRPLGFGEVLDGAFTTVQRYPKIMLGLSTAVMAVLTAAYFLTLFVGFGEIVTAANPDQLTRISDRTWVGMGATGIALVLVSWVATSVLTGMITVTVARGVLGRPATVGEVWRASRPHILRLLAVTFLIAAVFVVAIVVAVVVVVLAFLAHLVAGILTAVVLTCALIFLGVVFATRTALSTAVVVLETQPVDATQPYADQRRIPVVAAIRRSWALVRGRTPRTFGILFVANLVASVVSSVIQTAFTLLATGLGAGLGDSFRGGEFLALVLAGIGGLAASVLQIAFLAAVNALVYVDARMRSEGLDITLAQYAAADPVGGAGGAASSPGGSSGSSSGTAFPAIPGVEPPSPWATR